MKQYIRNFEKFVLNEQSTVEDAILASIQGSLTRQGFGKMRFDHPVYVSTMPETERSIVRNFRGLVCVIDGLNEDITDAIKFKIIPVNGEDWDEKNAKEFTLKKDDLNLTGSATGRNSKFEKELKKMVSIFGRQA